MHGHHCKSASWEKGEKAGGGPVFRGRREEEDGWIVDGGGEGEGEAT
jgi:hypothetical protein